MAEPRTVKRYANRKLYDTQTSSYVTLEQIAEMVREGEDVQIIDNTTKEDLTSVTLAQIVFEEEKKRRLIPLTTLKKIIQSKGESISGFVTQLGRDIDKQVGRVFRRQASEEGSTTGAEDELEDQAAAAGAEAMEGEGTGAAHQAPQGHGEAAHPPAGAHSSLEFLREWLISSQRSFEDWQAKLDDQVRKVVEGMSPLAPLQKQVERLTSKLKELEKRLDRIEGDEG